MSKEKAVGALPGIRKDEILAGHSWFRIGGPADWFLPVDDVDAAGRALRAAREDRMPVFILGAGSNVLFDSKGFRGLVLKAEFDGIEFIDEKVSAGAGVPLAELMRHSAENRLGGWEGLSGIPGTAGGAVRGNAGAYGTEIGIFTEKIYFMDSAGVACECNKEEAGFAYRHSIFKTAKDLIHRVEFALKEVDPAVSAARMKEIEEDRKKKHPQKNTAGCFFKNPKERGVSAARLIEQAGLKGKKEGGAGISELHSNFIVNLGGATSGDVLALAGMIRKTVEKMSGITLEEEVEIVPEKSPVTN
jgi:UDP-N-acetylmuramate dehydrogenase